MQKGNSEVYVICIDFDRSKFTNCFTTDFQINSIPYSTSFVSQLIKCSELFQCHQINTIQHNLHYFHNRNRRFNKKLNKIKSQMLDQYLSQCQIRQLLSNDRHLSKANLESKHFQQYNNRLTRTGTFNNQHEIDLDRIQNNIQNGFFCLICTNNQINDLCSTCHTVSQLMQDRTLTISHIYIGQLIANQKPIISCVFGIKTKIIRNSCFCNRYLLELCSKIDIDTVISVRRI